MFCYFVLKSPSWLPFFSPRSRAQQWCLSCPKPSDFAKGTSCSGLQHELGSKAEKLTMRPISSLRSGFLAVLVHIQQGNYHKVAAEIDQMRHLRWKVPRCLPGHELCTVPDTSK